jgi:hypothetical protein
LPKKFQLEKNTEKPIQKKKKREKKKLNPIERTHLWISNYIQKGPLPTTKRRSTHTSYVALYHQKEGKTNTKWRQMVC